MKMVNESKQRRCVRSVVLVVWTEVFEKWSCKETRSIKVTHDSLYNDTIPTHISYKMFLFLRHTYGSDTLMAAVTKYKPILNKTSSLPKYNRRELK